MRILLWNVEDFFLYVDAGKALDLRTMSEADWREASISLETNKPLLKVKAIARRIREIQPDVVGLCEVGGIESLRNFSAGFLDAKYTPCLIEGNSDRGIDVGYLIRSEFLSKNGWSFEHRSYRDRAIGFHYPHEQLSLQTGYGELGVGKEGHRFSRDVSRLTLRGADQAVLAELLLVHLKSKLDKEGIDPAGRDRRKAEFEALLEIAGEVKNERGASVPLILFGDFNGQVGGADADPEFAARISSDYVDVLAEKIPLWFDRTTHVGGLSRYRDSYVILERQLDTFLLERQFLDRVASVQVDRLGSPKTLEEKLALPSDHHGVLLEFDLS